MTQKETHAGVDQGGSLWTISRGGSLFFLGNVVFKVLLFLLNFILSRGLGATLYGIYGYARTLLVFAYIFAKLGTGESLHRFVPKYSDDPHQLNWVITLAYGTVLVTSVFIGASLFIAAPLITNLTLGEPLLTDALRIFAFIIPFSTVTKLTNEVFRAMKRLEYQVAISSVLQPTVNLLVVIVAFTLGFSLLGVVAAIAVGTVLVTIIAVTILYMRTDIRPTGDGTSGSAREFYNFSLPMTMKDVGSKLYNRVDVLMVGIFLTSSAVGIYRISALVATALVLPLAGINQLFPPIASELYSAGDMEELDSVYTILTRWVFTLVLLPATAVVIYSKEVLAVFGPEFPEGSIVLILFTIAQLTNAMSGPCGKLLTMTDHQYLNLLNQWALGVLNIILNYVLILRFGIIGAGLATASVLAVINVVRVIEVWYAENILPYSITFGKPLFAALCSAAIMLGARSVLADYSLLVIGSCVGLMVYAAVLLLLGLEPEDWAFYQNNIRDQFM